MLDNHVARQVLRFFERRRSGTNSGWGGCSVFHDWRRSELDRAIEIGCVTAHRFDLGKMSKGVDTRRIVEAEEEPESLLRRWRCLRRRRASERPRVIRPQLWDLREVLITFNFGSIEWNPNYGDLFIQCDILIAVSMKKGRVRYAEIRNWKMESSQPKRSMKSGRNDERKMGRKKWEEE